jgi:putative copper export protein
VSSVFTVAHHAQLANAWTIVRLSLHVLGACVWVGGQLVLAGLVVTLRGISHDAPGKVAKAFARFTWPAFGLLIVTGVWNVAVAGSHATPSWNMAFGIKMFCVIIAGLGAFMHTRAASPKAKGIFAGVGMLGTITAMVLGVALAG